MTKTTRGKDGRLYNGKGTRGGLAPSDPSITPSSAKALPTLPRQTSSLSEASDVESSNKLKLAAHKLAALKIKHPEPVSDLISDIESEAYLIEFPNHNSTSSEDWLSLEELIRNDKLCENNCDAVSGEIYNYLEETSPHNHQEISEIDLIQLDYTKGAHVATSFTVGKQKWVIDYTARQFDTTLPVPLVIPQDKWEELIDSYIWLKHKDSRV